MRGHARTEWDEMLRKRAELERERMERERPRHDPGEPGEPDTHLSPKVSRTVYEFRDCGIRTQVQAIHALSRREGAGLNPGQIAAVLAEFAVPNEQELAELDDDAAEWDTYPDGDGDGLPRQRTTQ